tara:strand:+ start:177 stop:482 length:306 start_codon:yes stop_codon:yes gene_type:complete
MKQTANLKKNQNLVLSLALICFLFMQFIYQDHQYDGNAHQPNHVCKVCNKLSSLGSTHTASNHSLFDLITARFIYRFSNISHDELITHRLIYLRGPPQIFT